jgi:hypothetical protein
LREKLKKEYQSSVKKRFELAMKGTVSLDLLDQEPSMEKRTEIIPHLSC